VTNINKKKQALPEELLREFDEDVTARFPLAKPLQGGAKQSH